MDKIKASKPYQMYERFKTWKTYHFIQALLSYIALITLLASLGLLNNPPEFPYPTQESDIKSATEFNAGKPNNSPLFRKLAGITGNEKMKNTKYIYAAENGKASVRVCTDLSKEEFEKIAGINEKQELRWDPLWYQGVQKLYEKGCVNASVLAYNGGCYDGPIYSKVTGVGSKTSWTGPYERGNCGTPTETAKLFTNPAGSNGWLWHYMIRPKATLNPWPDSKTLTFRNCSTTECDVAKCYDKSFK